MTPNFKFRPTSASVAAATIPAQEGTTEGFQSSTNGWEFKPTVDIKVTDSATSTMAETGFATLTRWGSSTQIPRSCW